MLLHIVANIKSSYYKGEKIGTIDLPGGKKGNRGGSNSPLHNHSLVPRLYPCARTQTNQKCNESEVKPGRTSHVQNVI